MGTFIVEHRKASISIYRPQLDHSLYQLMLSLHLSGVGSALVIDFFI